ncbi:MAG: BatA domain-containing protein [Planctomycetia bacterium]|nr:BatA domain-containing protein [Planctomycetia bacterium]
MFAAFVHPALLWGMLLLGLPLLIHLINLLRHRRVPWGAMEFLLAAYRKHRNRVRMKELLLLLLRMAAVALVVLAVAQPVLENRLGTLVGGVKVHHIVLLDDSFSMSDRMGETGAFDAAKNMLLRLTEETSKNAMAQHFTLLRTSQSSPGSLKPDFHAERIDSEFPERLRSVLDTLGPGVLAWGPQAALSAVDELVPDSPQTRRLVYVVSDFRQKDWRDHAELKKTLERLQAAGVALRLVDCVAGEHSNLGVSGLVPGDGIRAAGVPFGMWATVTNYGTTPAKDVVLRPETCSATATQSLPAVRIAEIPAGGTATCTFPVRFPDAGEQRIVVSLDSDAVEADNQAYAVVSLPPFSSALILSDTPDGEETRALLTALSPGGNVRTGVTTRVESPRFAATHSLDAFQAVYLLDVRQLDPAAVTALTEFVQNGGGLACFVGENTDPVLTQKWYRGGAGFFPVLLKQPTELPPDFLRKVPDLRVAEHPVFRVFSGKSATLAGTVNIRKYYTLEDESLETLLPLDTAAGDKEAGAVVRTLAALRNNAPLVVEKPLGKGRVLLFLTTSDARWNNWPQGNPSYVVAMLQLQAYLAGANATFPQRLAGAPLEKILPPELAGGDVRFFTPDGELWETVPAVEQKEGRFAAYSSATDRLGFYAVTWPPAETALPLAVNADPQEGEMLRLSGEELARQLDGIRYEYFPADAFRVSEESLRGFPLFDGLLYALLGVLFLEMLVAISASWHLKR